VNVGALQPPTVKVILEDIPPPDPDTVNVYVPAGTVLATVRVRIKDKDAPGEKEKELGEKTGVTPVGKPEVLNVDRNVLPAPSLVTLKLYVTLPPTPVRTVPF